MNTLLLEPTNWDLTLDASRNIALATEPYALAQDAASSIKAYHGEVYYDTARGVPYYPSILGVRPPLALLKAALVDAALLVPKVVAARVYISSAEDRHIIGQVQITDSEGVAAAAGF